MSSKYPVTTSLAGLDLTSKTKEELDSLFLKILNEGIHGISFSAYLEHQKPGSQISEAQVRERMEIIKPYIK